MKFPRNELSSQDLLMNILENVLKIPHSIVSAFTGAHKFVVYLGVV
jgi:hypothetical protein